MCLERPAPICLATGTACVRVSKILVIGDSHSNRLQCVNSCKRFDFFGISGCRARDWKQNFERIIENSDADLIIIQIGGNDVCEHPKKLWKMQKQLKILLAA